MSDVLPATVTCSRCKRHMFSTELAVENGKHVCNTKNAGPCKRMAAERKPRAKVTS